MAITAERESMVNGLEKEQILPREVKLNTIYRSDCVDLMNRMNEDFVDLTVTSPPYDELRHYNGYKFDVEEIAKSLLRVTKKGGMVVWVVGDKIKNGNRSLTSFRQALLFQDVGFNAHDVMIYKKKILHSCEQMHTQTVTSSCLFSAKVLQRRLTY